MSEDFYKAKYLVYKKKYLDLKKVEAKLKMTGGSGKPDLILFKADWCGHCQRFKPVWNQIKNSFNKVNYREFDADIDKTVIEKYNMSGYKISGYPTIMLKKGENMIEYNGERNQESIVNFIKSYTKSN